MSLIVDTTLRMIQTGLDLREQRERLLASNLANVDTPLFVPLDLEGEGNIDTLQVAGPSSGLSMQRSQSGHLRAGDSEIVFRGATTERPDATSSLDNNRVDLDAQVARFADNAVRLSATAEIARRRLALVNYTISKMSGGA